jgi:short-subunit dehydrogenase involved in D-alanine esterification of teichoic acids
MDILKNQPDAVEICVENVKPLRLAAEKGMYDKVFNGMNEAMARPH